MPGLSAAPGRVRVPRRGRALLRRRRADVGAPDPAEQVHRAEQVHLAEQVEPTRRGRHRSEPVDRRRLGLLSAVGGTIVRPIRGLGSRTALIAVVSGLVVGVGVPGSVFLLVSRHSDSGVLAARSGSLQDDLTVRADGASGTADGTGVAGQMMAAQAGAGTSQLPGQQAMDRVGTLPRVTRQIRTSRHTGGTFTSVSDLAAGLAGAVPGVVTDGGTGRAAASGTGGGPAMAVDGASVLAVAKRYFGIPYLYGGTTPTTGFDCSGYVKYVFAQLGITLPRTADEQMHATTMISRAQAQPGDLVSFIADGVAFHNGIYAGNGMMYDAPHTGAFVGPQKVWSTNVIYSRVTH